MLASNRPYIGRAESADSDLWPVTGLYKTRLFWGRIIRLWDTILIFRTLHFTLGHCLIIMGRFGLERVGHSIFHSGTPPFLPNLFLETTDECLEFPMIARLEKLGKHKKYLLVFE